MFVYSVSLTDLAHTPEEITRFLKREINAEDIETTRGGGDPPGLVVRFRHLWIEPETVAAQFERCLDLKGVSVRRGGEAGIAVDEPPPETEAEDKGRALQRRILDLVRDTESMSPEELGRILTRRSGRDIRAAIRDLETLGVLRHAGSGRYTLAPMGRALVALIPAMPDAGAKAKPARARPRERLDAGSPAARIRDLLEVAPVLTRGRIMAALRDVSEDEIGRAVARLLKGGILRRAGDLLVRGDCPDPTPEDAAAQGIGEAGAPQASPFTQDEERVLGALARGKVLTVQGLEALFPKPGVLVRRALASLIEAGRIRRVGQGVYVAAEVADPTPEEIGRARSRRAAGPARGSADAAVLRALKSGAPLRVNDLVAQGEHKDAAVRSATTRLLHEGRVRRLAQGIYIASKAPEPAPEVLAALQAQPARRAPAPKAGTRRTKRGTRRIDRGLAAAILARLGEGAVLGVAAAAALRPGASRNAARQCLSKLEEKGTVRREGRGLFVAALAAPEAEPAASTSPPGVPGAFRPGRLHQAILDHLAAGGEITASEVMERVPGTSRTYASVALSALLKAGRIRRVAMDRYAGREPGAPPSPPPEAAPRVMQAAFHEIGRPEPSPSMAGPVLPSTTGLRPGSIASRILDELRAGGALRLEEISGRLPMVHPPSIKTALSALVKSGEVLRTGRGVYEAAPSRPAASSPAETADAPPADPPLGTQTASPGMRASFPDPPEARAEAPPADPPPLAGGASGDPSPKSRPGTITHAIQKHFRKEGPLNLQEIFQRLPTVHAPSVKTALSALTKGGLIRRVGKGRYEAGQPGRTVGGSS